MLDIGWWELLVVGMIALVVVGPKELPTLLRTIGRYVGMAKRQADEFRAQFDEALRESEFNDLRNEMNEIKSDVTSSLDDAQQSIDKDLRDEYDWDKDGAIEPAPEFADDKETTSFTMPDGEVVKKKDAGEVVTKKDAGAAADTHDAAASATPANDTAPVDVAEAPSDAAADAPASSDKPDHPPARDAEAVR